MNMNMSMEIRYIEPAALHDEMLRLRQEEQMDFLECLTGMDWGEPDAAKDTPDTPRGLGVVYQLESTVTGKRTAIRTATLNREHPELPSVCDIWKAADFLEREVFDFYGVVFVGHPDMRRLYLRNDWVGYPLRKDADPAAQPFGEEAITGLEQAKQRVNELHSGSHYHLMIKNDIQSLNACIQYPVLYNIWKYRVREQDSVRSFRDFIRIYNDGM